MKRNSNTMNGEELVRNFNNEIQLAEDECCIIFDFGCYFPYANPEILTFDFSLGEEEFEDKKLNHRYPNKGYQTISKTFGRKVSKLGYPYVMKINEQVPMLLCLKVGIKENVLTVIIGVKTNMTKEKPICSLSLQYLFDEHKMRFISNEICKDGGWLMHSWYNYEEERKCDGDIILKAPRKASNGSYTLIYDDFIEPCPSTIEDLLIL